MDSGRPTRGRSRSSRAEAEALRRAGDAARGATLYVNLEPCSHHGRTPPCADRIVESGVRRVVAAIQDPNPLVAGQGLQALRDAGIEVQAGLLEDEAASLNPGFIMRMRQARPWLRCKLAMSLDGRTAMANGESQWITGPDARADVQRLRARSSAIISGADSVLLDDSALTVRASELGLPGAEADAAAARQPLRVLVDGRMRVPLDSRLFRQPGPILVVCRGVRGREQDYGFAGAELLTLPDAAGEHVDLKALVEELGERQCNELLVESGAGLAGAFLQAGLVDELIVYMAPRLLGSRARPLLNLPIDSMADAMDLDVIDMRVVGRDWRITARPIFPS